MRHLMRHVVAAATSVFAVAALMFAPTPAQAAWITNITVNPNGKLVITGSSIADVLTLYYDSATDEYVIKTQYAESSLVLDNDSVCYRAKVDKMVRCPHESLSGYTALLGGGNDQLALWPSWSLPGRIWLGDDDDYVDLVGNRWTNVDGGAGDDMVNFSMSRHPVTVTLDGVQNDGITGNPKVNVSMDIEIVRGTGYDDMLIGNDRRNELDGAGGDDQMYGLGGADFLNGSDGSDYADGGDKWDTCYTSEMMVSCEVDF